MTIQKQPNLVTVNERDEQKMPKILAWLTFSFFIQVDSVCTFLQHKLFHLKLRSYRNKNRLLANVSNKSCISFPNAIPGDPWDVVC